MKQRWGQLYGAARALALADAARESGGPLLVVTRGASEAERLTAELRFFTSGKLAVLHFPDWETLPYDAFSPHPDITSTRLRTLAQLPTLTQGLIVAAAGTLLQRLPPRSHIDAHSLSLRPGERFDLPAMRARLESAGYVCVPQVGAHGEFAVRGSLFDVFPMGADMPCRVDLFDEVIESLRGFDPDTQRSGEKIPALDLLPAHEFPFNEEAIRAFRQNWRRRFEGDPQRSQVYREVSQGITPGGIEYWLPLFFEATADLFEYMPACALVALDDGAETAWEAAWLAARERHEQMRGDLERPLLEPEEILLSPGELAGRIDPLPGVQMCPHELESPGPGERNVPAGRPPSLLIDARAEAPTAALRAHIDAFPGRILLVAESRGRREALREMLDAHAARPVPVESWEAFRNGSMHLAITVAPLENGLLWHDPALSVVAESQLYGERVRTTRRRKPQRDPEAIIRDLSDLHAGAPVVHVEHGVGRYLGLQTLDVDGIRNEFLAIEYAGGDKLYVPVASLHLVSRYTGAAPEHAPLHRLGGEQWQRAKRRAAKKLRDVAAELLDIQARRAARSGHAFRLNPQEFAVFCADFPFETTADQQTAIDTVVDDLTTSRPMDRVVCGDVGFGKTEVALRAAFIAVQDGKQVAVLVPTTLLAQQHSRNFQDRFADWPVRIGVLSRLRSDAQQSEVFEGMATGTLDIVIGTHKMLGNMARFRRLGLVIVDEEHRFGVRHKERLKQLRAEVDMLTLTATPIPRTMNMTLSGLRDLSIIATPPEGRLAIKTFVCEWNDVIVREACQREIRRGGQVYFLHNEVESIDRAAERVRTLLPEASVRVAHGRMRERELEQVMLDFYHRRYNVLVCTTIIESGIDIPSANTIIVNRADKLGLAQLHQLRGRVGRSHHRAYAYLLTPERGAMTADAVKRLEAVESLEELGAGFTLATHDLEIRGAGELLGEEQSGQIEEIGFSMYNDMLARAVQAMRRGELPDLTGEPESGAEIDLQIPALFPDDYIPDVHTRLVFYKRIATAATAAALDELQVELIDRFGLLPDPTKNLFEIAQLRQLSVKLGITRIDCGPTGGRLQFQQQPAVEAQALIDLVQDRPREYRFDGRQTLRFNRDLDDAAERVRFCRGLLEQLSGHAQTP